jgi:hypothetical protein
MTRTQEIAERHADVQERVDNGYFFGCSRGGIAHTDRAYLLDRVAKLTEALTFYADPKRYQGPNQKAIDGDKFNPKGDDAVYYHDVSRDHGEIARAALSETDT